MTDFHTFRMSLADIEQMEQAGYALIGHQDYNHAMPLLYLTLRLRSQMSFAGAEPYSSPEGPPTGALPPNESACAPESLPSVPAKVVPLHGHSVKVPGA